MLSHDPLLILATTASGWAHERTAAQILASRLRDRDGEPTSEGPMLLDELLELAPADVTPQLGIKAHADPPSVIHSPSRSTPRFATPAAGSPVSQLRDRLRRNQPARVDEASPRSPAAAAPKASALSPAGDSSSAGPPTTTEPHPAARSAWRPSPRQQPPRPRSAFSPGRPAPLIPNANAANALKVSVG